jgi:menaquinone-dependent protoporphyrinogen oxidase
MEAVMPLKIHRWVLIALTGAAAIGAGLWAATWRPAPQLLASTCKGDTQMQKKILVAYATRTGSTAEVAEAIAKRFCDAGFSAEMRHVTDLDGLDGYSAAVFGSAIRLPHGCRR